MDPIQTYLQNQTRRHFFRNSALGLGSMALGSLLAKDPAFVAQAAKRNGVPGIPGLPHFAPKAKRVIYLFMSGAPSQMDMFDYKPEMGKWFDKDLPESIRMGQRLTTMTSGQKRFPIAPSIYNFKKYDNNENGAWISELLPHTGTVAKDLAILRTVYTEAINHDPAITYILTGFQIPGFASMGAWLSYGLGNETDNLPSFVVLNSTWTGRKEAQALFSRLWGSAFLPSKHQGVLLRSAGDPVLFLSNPKGVSPKVRRRMLDALDELNQQQFNEVGDPDVQARIAQYEMAFRMQSSIPELTDLKKEPDSTFEKYGPDSKKEGTFAYNCLMARRLAERGTRFTQIFHRGWDQHFKLPKDLPNQCRDIDQPVAALINDLKERGLLDDTLVVWGGEFGRTIYCQGELTKTEYGRDHHPKCFTMWMAGGGVKPGIVHGETDEFSYNVVHKPVHIHEINATILHLLGIDAWRFSMPVQGLDARLTGATRAEPVSEIML
ncbi:MAG: DUF1501 domain-containing protein [Verrucomicrobiota bacterium]|nr:DUF1501 domain-containing protein [Verrucomicrobiota bacterium]